MTSSEIWLKIRRTNFTDWKILSDFLELSCNKREHLLKTSHFPLNLPLHIAQKIKKKSLDDPLLRQFLPVKKEEETQEGFVFDPVSEQTFCKSPNLLSKYRSRALLIASRACAMHCRYCFRRHFPYEGGSTLFEKELELISQDSTLSEVILSGGDPLSLPNKPLGQLIEKLSKIPHLKRVRFHTRFPLGIPERIDEGFLTILQKCPLQILFVLHCNHPNELDSTILTSLKQLQKLGIPILNQAVLLRGVNDDAETLKELFESLSNHGIIPYYLHQLDPVAGAAHFHVTESKGRQLMQELSKLLPGYAVPRYVKEVPSAPHKTIIT